MLRSSRAPASLSALTSSSGAPLPALERTGVEPGLGFAPALGLNAALAVLLAAVAANASRTGSGWAIALLYLSIAWMFLPLAFRILHPRVARTELLATVVIAVIGLFAVRVVRAPVAFVDFDEFLHWATALDIIETGRLFAKNPLLPVSPLYPGLEIVTIALVHLSGLTLFQASLILLAVARLAFILAFFQAYEHIAGSSRIAAIACLIYMGCSTFVIFDSHFSYESLAVVFLVLVLLVDARAPPSVWRDRLLISVPLLLALAVTHHMTAVIAAGLLVARALLDHARPGRPGIDVALLATAGLAVLLPWAWSNLMGNPGSGYLGPVLLGGLQELSRLLTFSLGRTPFESEDGSLAPAWQRFITIGSVAFVSLGLATGFLGSLRLAGMAISARTLARLRWLRGWDNSWIVVLTLFTVGYPLSILFRLTRSGWEIGNRIGPFTFFGVALVVAVAIAGIWVGRSPTAVRRAAAAGACTVILIGGIISAEGPRILVPATFQVSADAASIEPMSIAASEWTGDWLGRHNLFAADRINRLLLATYGRQQVATTLSNRLDTGVAILAETLGRAEARLLRTVGVDFVMVDLRLTTALPTLGVYFDGAAADRHHRAPPRSETLLKFNSEASVGRVFDNGYLVIYDVRTLDARQ